MGSRGSNQPRGYCLGSWIRIYCENKVSCWLSIFQINWGLNITIWDLTSFFLCHFLHRGYCQYIYPTLSNLSYWCKYNIFHAFLWHLKGLLVLLLLHHSFLVDIIVIGTWYKKRGFFFLILYTTLYTLNLKLNLPECVVLRRIFLHSHILASSPMSHLYLLLFPHL